MSRPERGIAPSLALSKLHPLFAAELRDVDLRAEPSADLVAAVEAAMDEHAVLVIRGQRLSDEEHIRFSRAFGPLELPPNLGVGGSKRRLRRELYDASNLDEHGALLTADSQRRRYNRGNELFHTDSSFNSLPTKWSLLLSHVLPPSGGNTDFVDMRAVYDELPRELKERIETLTAEHSLWHSRSRVGFAEVTQEMRSRFPPARHPLVRRMPNGRKALYVGAHASHVVELPLDEGRELLQSLYERAIAPRYVYSHAWQAGDLVIWDNRCTLHRAGGGYDELEHVRDLRRTTVNEHGPEVASTDLTAAGRTP